MDEHDEVGDEAPAGTSARRYVMVLGFEVLLVVALWLAGRHFS